MIKTVMKALNIPHNDFDKKNLTYIFKQEELRELKIRITSNHNNSFQEYLSKCYLQHESNQDDEQVLIELLNVENIDNKSKETVLANEKMKITSLKDVSENMYKTIINLDKMVSNYSNIFAYYLAFGEIGEELVTHISKHLDDYTKQKIHVDAVGYTKEDVKKFIEDYIYSKFVDIKDFKKMVPTFKIVLSSLEELNNEKLAILIKTSSLVVSPNMFDAIKKQNKLLSVSYIVKNIEYFVTEIKSFNIIGCEEDILYSSSITKENKKLIIKEKQIDLVSLSPQLLVELLNDEIIDVDDNNVNEKIFKSDIDIKLKIKTLIKYIKLRNEDTILYLQMLNEDYRKLCDITFPLVSIPSTKENEMLIGLLKDEGFISSFREVANNKINIYNYRK